MVKVLDFVKILSKDNGDEYFELDDQKLKEK